MEAQPFNLGLFDQNSGLFGILLTCDCALYLVLCWIFFVFFFIFKKVCFLLNSFLLRIVKFNIESHEGPLNLESLSDWIKPMLHPFHSDCYPGQLASYYGFGGISWEAPSFSSLHTIISSSFFLFFFLMISKVHSPSQFDIFGGI